MPERFIADQDKERLDNFLVRNAKKYSRSMLQKLCDQDLVLVNDQPRKSSYTLHVGDRVIFDEPEPVDFSKHTLPVIYEDQDVVVINKPYGVLTHAKGSYSDEFSVAEYMRPRTTDGIETNRPGIVHRLDRETSGVIIAAKNHESKVWLQKQFSLRKAKKTYIALLRGRPKESAAIIDLPIDRDPKKPQTFRVSASGKSAETVYRTLRNYGEYTLVEFSPKTGRTHQLRVHAKYLGCPIVGDRMYGEENKQLGRMFLHASSLEITLPSRERVTFRAEISPELEQFLGNLK